MNNAKKNSNHRLHILFGIFIVIVPLIPLLKYRYFYVDFSNNLWVIQYYAKYFRIHHSFPLTINTSNKLVGMTNPLFYGYIYYQFMGLLDICVGGARRALLICIVMMLSAVYILYSRIFMRAFHEAGDNCFWISHCITAVMMWSTYAITKMYDDGARGEYFGIQLLYIAIGCWILALYQNNDRRKAVLWSFMATDLMFLCGTHPITIEIGGSILFVIILLSLPRVMRNTDHRFRTAFIGLILIILIVLSVSPWLFVVRNAGNTRIGINYLDAVDKRGASNFINRLMPFPFDVESVFRGLDVSSPYLDLQINIPLLIIYMYTIVCVMRNRRITRKNRAYAGIIAFLSILMFLFCSSDRLIFITKHIFYSIQSVYRLITYVDLFVLLGTCFNISILLSSADEAFRKRMMTVMLICITLSFHNVLIQMSQAYALANYTVADISSDRAPSHFYWGDDYSDISVPVPDNVEKSECYEVQIPMSSETLLPESVECTVAKGTIVVTNVSVSRYNAIYVNGQRLSDQNLFRIASDKYTYAFKASEDGKYRITTEIEMPYIYIWLRRISYISMILLTIGTICCCLTYFGRVTYRFCRTRKTSEK